MKILKWSIIWHCRHRDGNKIGIGKWRVAYCIYGFYYKLYWSIILTVTQKLEQSGLSLSMCVKVGFSVAEELRKQNSAWQVCRIRHPDETFIHWLENDWSTKKFPLPYSRLRNIFLWAFKKCVSRFNQQTYTNRWLCWMARKVSCLVPRNFI